MTCWGRGTTLQDWDPMRDDYNDSIYDAQYADDNTDSGVQLDHTKLYITNIPQTLNEEGLKFVFTKYGNVIKLFMSRDPKKRFALVSYESPSEAKLAMMKLNRAEPLKLNVSVAHKKTNQSDESKERSSRPSASWNRSYKDESSSVSSKAMSKNMEPEYANDEEEYNDDDESIASALDPELHLELNQIKLEELALQDKRLKCQQETLRMRTQQILLLSRAGKKQTNPLANRVFTADGKIVLKATSDRLSRARRPEPAADSTYSGGGDSLKIPGLQRADRLRCLTCGERAEYFCSGCGVAPYCAVKCQRADWNKRHRSVCHNLARLSDGVEGNNNVTDDFNGAPSVKQGSRSPKRKPQDEDNSSRNTELDCRFDKKNTSSVRGRNFSPKNVNVRRPNTKESELSTEPRPKSNDNIPKAAGYRAENKAKDFSTKADTESRPAVIYGDAQATVSSKQNGTYGLKNIPQKNTKPESLQNGVSPAQGAVPSKMVPLDVRSTIRPTPPKKPQPVQTPENEKPSPITLPKIEILPKMFIVSTFSVGDTILMSVEADASKCHTKQKGFVCLAVNESCEDKYNILCSDYCADCKADKETYTPKPGDLFSFYNPEDEDGWYRARCLNPTTAALIDACQVATIAPTSQYKKVLPKYQEIPEFCCVLEAGNVNIGDSLIATITSKDSCESVRVELQKGDTGENVGKGTITRWSPDIELPIPTPVAPVIPQVLRPCVSHGSRVILVDVFRLDAVYVRPAGLDAARQYNEALQQGLLAGRNGTPLTEPPVKGQLVVSQFSDGNHYRALVQRTSVAKNKYLLEYVEFGNVDTNPLEKLYPCPDSLSLQNLPSVVSQVKINTDLKEITEAANEYITKIRDDELELILTLPNGAKTAPSGSEAILTLEKNNENFTQKIVEMCTPGWKKLEQNGTDVVELKPLMFREMQVVEVPQSCELVVLDVSVLEAGVLAGYPKDCPHAPYILDKLPDLMAEYCNSELGREPYLPSPDELCITQCPPDTHWYRAALCEQTGGAGGSEAQVCFVDYGNMAAVPVRTLRKMLPDFVQGLPALVSHLHIRGFPENPTITMLQRALEYLQLDDNERGRLVVTNCKKVDNAFYEVDAPGLLAAMGCK